MVDDFLFEIYLENALKLQVRERSSFEEVFVAKNIMVENCNGNQTDIIFSNMKGNFGMKSITFLFAFCFGTQQK
jgi:hypothetical protein